MISGPFTDTLEKLTRLHGVTAPEDWKLVALAVESGLREEEQFSCRWDQIDLENGVLTLPLPKGGHTRHVPLSEGAKAILRSFESFTTSPYVFPSVRDALRPLCPDSFLRNTERHCFKSPEGNRDLNRYQEIPSIPESAQPLDLVVRPEGLEPPTPRSVVSPRYDVKESDTA